MKTGLRCWFASRWYCTFLRRRACRKGHVKTDRQEKSRLVSQRRNKGAEFILVDADQNGVGRRFDHARLARALGREAQPTEVPFDSVEFSEEGKSFSFRIANRI